ncbi:MAG: aminotransferase class V-fold PLP-dependent enzyme, partial [Burkholderiales bacterium]
YKAQSEADSMYNTPSTYPIYMAGLVFQWLKRGGGLKAMEERNIAKARLLYDCIDASGLYQNKVAQSDRSRMNVVFTLRDEKLDAAFLKATEAAGMAQLKGHRSVGGMRASIYNAMPMAGVEALVALMRDFEKSHG